MYYSILHKTRYRYSMPVRESVTEVRMRPRSEGLQRCLNFEVRTEPQARVNSYLDAYGNTVHHFDIPGPHQQLVITAEAVVVFTEMPALPERLEAHAWAQVDQTTDAYGAWDFLLPSRFARPSALLLELEQELKLGRRDDPLSLLCELNRQISETFAYAPQTTDVDSPIDEALESRRGVCQDFSHIMITLVRRLGIPCRYVSGYLFHRREDHDRSEEDATHAWIEALLPGLGWIGFDPTNNLLAGSRHIRTAIGRDYADVPPTRGVFRGQAESELDVGVKVAPTEAPLEASDAEMLPAVAPLTALAEPSADQQEQQQQQQQ
jgi:transglutaminase-like putative cysteine protease